MAIEQKNKEILVFDTFKEMSEFVLKKWGETAESAVGRCGRFTPLEKNFLTGFTVALSGGKTPLPFYNSLADQGKNLPWKNTHIFLVDERFVPHNDHESNFGRIKKTLFSKIDIPSTNIHHIYIDGTAKDAAEKYEEDMRNFFKLKAGNAPQFDLIILGIGEDGHTASLFLNHEHSCPNYVILSTSFHSA